MKNFLLKTVVIACAATALVGCGDSDTTLTEIAPTPTPINDGHNHGGKLGKGRLAIAEVDQSVVHIFDLKDNSLVESITLTNQAEYLYASPEGRYAVAVQPSLDRVEFIDGGVWQQLHGDHYHQHSDAPELTSFTLKGVKPNDYVRRGDKAAVFFDGNKETGVNAGLSLLSDESIGAQKVIAEHHFDTYMHGTAEIRGHYVLTTLREIDAQSSLPERVALLAVHGEHFHKEQVFETRCPAVDGSFETEGYIAFACSDGILAIEQQGSVFTAKKINNPIDMKEGVRIGSLKGSEESHIMIGKASSGFFLVDLAATNITPFNWQQAENLTAVTYGFDGHNEHMLILDNEGHLNLFSAESHWQFEKRFKVYDTLAEEAKPLIISSKAHPLVYIINGQEVTTIDLHDGKVVEHFDLDFMPGKAAWLGVAAKEEHQH